METRPLLVTGAAGFIGAKFVESCNQNEIPVISVDKVGHFKSRPEHRHIDFGKVVDRDHLFDWLEKETPVLSGIVHLGACTDTTQLDEAYLQKINYEYSQQIWNYATQKQLTLAYASSAATYGEGEQGYDDNESQIGTLKPLNPYGRSKQEFDLWALEQERAGHHPPAWSGFKFFNVYGFGERHKGKMSSVVVQAFDQIQNTGKVKLFKSHKNGIEDGYQKRDFIYVDDVVDVLNFALTKPIDRGIYNLGTGQARPFVELVRAVFKTLEKPMQVDFIDTPPGLRERYQYFTQANMQKLREVGYDQEFTSLEKGVSQYVNQLRLD